MPRRRLLLVLLALCGRLAAGEAPSWTALAWMADGRLASCGSGHALAADTPLLAGPEADGGYGPALVRIAAADGRALAMAGFPAGCFRPSAIIIGPGAVYLGGYASPGFAGQVASLPGLRVHDAGFAQRRMRPYTPPEHRDEPRLDPALDRRGCPCVLRLPPDLGRIEAAALLEGWESAWYVPEEVHETWRQDLLMQATAEGDLLVVHDGGLNRAREDGQAQDFADYCLAVDHVSRLAPDLGLRRWHSTLGGPPVDAQAIARNLGGGVHFRRTRATDWTADRLGNPRACGLAMRPDGTALVAGWAASRTAEEPWWCPFLRRVDAAGAVQDGPYSPSPTAGDGRLRGLVSDSAVFAVAALADGGCAVALAADGGNTIARNDPLDPFAPARWNGEPDPFRGRTLFWGGIARLDAGGRLRWGLNLGGQGFDQRQRPTQLPCWADRLLARSDGGLIASGRVAAGARIAGLVSSDESAFILGISPEGQPGKPLLLPHARIQGLALAEGRLAIGGRDADGPLMRLISLDDLR